MKKSFYSLVACAVLCLAACTEKGPDENGGNKDYVDFSGGKINLVLPASKTVEADADGVSVSIKEVTNANVTFECRPGANVQSYRLDVIPLSMLYNTIINEGLVGASKDEIDELEDKKNDTEETEEKVEEEVVVEIVVGEDNTEAVVDEVVAEVVAEEVTEEVAETVAEEITADTAETEKRPVAAIADNIEDAFELDMKPLRRGTVDGNQLTIDSQLEDVAEPPAEKAEEKSAVEKEKQKAHKRVRSMFDLITFDNV